jgi:eukaryotic-like serine/threonine-protein kinase
MTSTTERRVADRYVLREVLGKGGMGVVWRADDTLLRRRVAVKEIEFPQAPGVHGLDVVRERATREARTAAALTHSNIIAIYDTIHDDGRAYIVMEYVEAPTLATLIERDGRMDPRRAASIALDILEALEVAHAAGIVHRDVKPANVMVPPEGHAKLADFGIAIVKDDPKLTSTGMVLGSPQFMAPEQASGARSGSEADLWALGTTLYYMVEGVCPFDQGEPIPTLAAVVHDPPREPRRAGPLEPVIAELLQKDPGARPTSPRIREMLEKVVAGDPLLAASAEGLQSETSPAVDVPAQARTGRGRSRRMVAGVTAVLVVVGGGLFLATRPGPAPPSESNAGEEKPGDAGGPRVPKRWVEYEDPDTGYRISHPPGWHVSPLGDTRTDIRHPSNGMYLRVDWTATPGDDPVAAWESFSESFAARHEDYNKIRIEATEYHGFDAAVWEFTYSDEGTSLHAIDLGFVTDEYGFALNFQTRAEDWTSSQRIFERFQASFEPPV